MACGPITSWQIDGETVETVRDYFVGLRNHCRWWLQPWNQKMLCPWKKSYNQPAAAKSLQSYLTLCDPIDGSPLGSSVPGILQARTLEWVAISFSNAWKWKVKVKSLSRVRLLATPWTAAYQALPSMWFPRQEYWSRVPLPSPERLRILLIKWEFPIANFFTIATSFGIFFICQVKC